MNGVYFVAETRYTLTDFRTNLVNAGKAIRIEAKSLTVAKIKATKLWQGNPYRTSVGCTMLVLGDHIDASGHIDHVLFTKNSRYYGNAPCWCYYPTWIEREDVEEAPEEAPEAPELNIGDTVKVISDKFERDNALIGLTGFIYDEIEDEAGNYFIVEFDHPVGGCLRWAFMPQDLENMKEEAIMKKGNIGDTMVILRATQGQPEETVGQLGVITDIFDDPEGKFCTVKFDQQFHGWNSWDYKPTEIAHHVAEG